MSLINDLGHLDIESDYNEVDDYDSLRDEIPQKDETKKPKVPLLDFTRLNGTSGGNTNQ
jgi:hypothetical protein